MVNIVWHFTGPDGVRRSEELTPEQASVDKSIVKAFETIEGDVSVGRKPADSSIAVVSEALTLLPTERAKHWVKELARVGVTPKVAAKPAATDKGDKK